MFSFSAEPNHFHCGQNWFWKEYLRRTSILFLHHNSNGNAPPSQTTDRRARKPMRSLATPVPLRFYNFSFIYPSRNQKTLLSITLTIALDISTALDGLSGSGNSTMASILLGLQSEVGPFPLMALRTSSSIENFGFETIPASQPFNSSYAFWNKLKRDIWCTGPASAG